jgi:hypothetical protein
MAAPVLYEVVDGRGRTVKIHEPSWNHMTRGHPELQGAEEAVRLTIGDPDMVLRPQNRPKGRGIDRRVNCRLGTHSGYKHLYVVVPIDYQGEESWMVTAYLSPSPPKGKLLFVRVPIRWS